MSHLVRECVASTSYRPSWSRLVPYSTLAQYRKGQMPLSEDDKNAIRTVATYATDVNASLTRCLTQVQTSEPRISCGRASFSLGVMKTVSQDEAIAALLKHAQCKWEHLSPREVARNTFAVENGGPLLSVHKTTEGKPFVIFTRSDRSASLLLLPEEFKKERQDRPPASRPAHVINQLQVRRQLYRYDYCAEQRDLVRTSTQRPQVCPTRE